ncbi:carbamoyl-phosphate synthase large subunit, partial [Peptoniphilus senegalensis]|uniref:carbamoyl-phosphate synthase large subunit n=1 Tax=Peptoniphilus senegalensis TaxID=1465757 RepID=UPI00399B2044
IELIHDITGIDLYFLEKIENIVREEENLKKLSLDTMTPDELAKLKKLGFSDKTIAKALGVKMEDVIELREKNNILPNYRRVDTSPFRKNGAYYYSTYEKTDENIVSANKKIIVIGSGPIRIGQGIEFDYCSVHAIKALIKMGIETVTINNNPETVSTDFDTSDKLYFEPLTEEEVKSIIEIEKPLGVILAFGGQTAIKLAKYLHSQKINILGTDFEDIDRAEDREKFDEMLEELKINRPKGHGVFTVKEGLDSAKELGYPLLVRPSYVLGGQGMQITYDEESLKTYLQSAFERDAVNPVLIDKYLVGREIEVDAISDGEDILIPGIMEHLERAGVHSGDSITIYPSLHISDAIKAKILDYTKKIAKALHVKGMINIQFIEYKNDLYIIEVNPRASRTVPYISKVSGVPIVDLATKTMLGEKLSDLGYGVDIYKEPKLMAVKVPVFSMSKLNRVEISLGPEMKSTGEVLGVGKDIDEALFKGFLAAGSQIENEVSRVLATVNDNDKKEFIEIAKTMKDLGYKFIATKGTCQLLKKEGIDAREIGRINDPRPNILDVIRNGEIDIVVNTPTRGGDSTRDGFKIRRMATEYGIDIVTSLDTLAARVAVKNKKFHEENMDIYDITKF